MPVTVLTRVRTVRMWFLYSWMALGSVKKSLQSVAVVVQLVYAHLLQTRLNSACLIAENSPQLSAVECMEELLHMSITSV